MDHMSVTEKIVAGVLLEILKYLWNHLRQAFTERERREISSPLIYGVEYPLQAY